MSKLNPYLVSASRAFSQGFLLPSLSLWNVSALFQMRNVMTSTYKDISFHISFWVAEAYLSPALQSRLATATLPLSRLHNHGLFAVAKPQQPHPFARTQGRLLT
jgi:hypothetical protein